MEDKRQNEYSGSPSDLPANKSRVEAQGMIDSGESMYETCQHK